jgi:hypothetical protein
MTNFVKTRGKRLLPYLSNFCCLPGRAGGSPYELGYAAFRAPREQMQGGATQAMLRTLSRNDNTADAHAAGPPSDPDPPEPFGNWVRRPSRMGLAAHPNSPTGSYITCRRRDHCVRISSECAFVGERERIHSKTKLKSKSVLLANLSCRRPKK